MTRTRRFVAAFTAASLTCAVAAPGARAQEAGGLISAEQVAASQGLRTAEAARASLRVTLQRDDVVSALTERGVTLEQARARVAALTDAEALALAAEIDKAPAGAGELIGSVALVFVLLLFSDILGFTHIFPFVKPIR